MIQKTLLAFLILGLLVGCSSKEETPEASTSETNSTEKVESYEGESPAEPSGASSRLYRYYEEYYVDKDYYYDMKTTFSADEKITESISSTAEMGEKSYMAKDDESGHIAQIMDEEFIYLLDHEVKVVQKYPRPEDYQSPMEQALDTLSKLDIKSGEGQFFDKTYETEYFEFMGTTTTYFFDGDMLVGYEQRTGDQVSYSELLNYTTDVDESIFIIPEDYEMEDFSVESLEP